jgi:hypothetical protein
MMAQIGVVSRAWKEVIIPLKIGQCARADEIANTTGQPLFEAWVHQNCKLRAEAN